MENIVSKFIVSTCRMGGAKFSIGLNSESNFFQLPLLCCHSRGVNFEYIVCGSQAEFYIEPINPCIDDVDVLRVVDNHLASDSSVFEILGGVGDLCDVILRTKIEHYEENPSFVRLRDPICGAYDWNLEEYKFINMPAMSFMPRDLSPTNILGMMENCTTLSSVNGKVIVSEELQYVILKTFTVNGPALKSTTPGYGTRDLVSSVRCPKWPLAAEEWPKRRRCSGWPSSATINKVVRDGCDVVPITHRDMHKELNQWRLSFSRAEVTLIQSWNLTQQIVYHLLRFFAKREIIRKNCEKAEEVVCTYHLKTLMLWSCETEPTEWWETSSVVSICCKFLGKLCECLMNKHCPHYFIRRANLLDHKLNDEILCQTIKTVDYFNDVDKMSRWLATHYILPVYQELCNEDESVLTEETIERCGKSIFENDEKRKLNDLNATIFLCALNLFVALKFSYDLQWAGSSTLAGNDRSIRWFIDTTAISKVHSALADYTKALILFQVSQFILSSKLQCDVDLLSDIWIHIIRQSHFVEISNSVWSLSVLDGSTLYFNRAEQILKHLTLSYSKNENCFAKMVSMLCLQNSLSSQDASSSKTETASRLYLAALLSFSGFRQCAVHLCSEVATGFIENNHNDCREVRHLKISSLLCLHDVATIAGFLLLRRNILRIPSKGIFFLSPDLFVHYLLIQCNPEELEIKDTLGESLIFEADYCLAAIMRHYNLRRFDRKFKKILIYSRFTEDKEDTATDIALPGSTDIAEALVRISNDYMTRFYASLSVEFGTNFNLASCYEALTLYLCRRYEDVICLCEKLLEESENDHNSDLEDFQFLNVNVSLYFIAYFDEDIQALVGFQLLVLRLSPLPHNVFETKPVYGNDKKWMSGLQFLDRISQSVAVYETYNNAFKPILRRQFIGNYLKLRCLLDLGFPLFEVESAFRCLESRFLFERTLLHFMREKLTRCY